MNKSEKQNIEIYYEYPSCRHRNIIYNNDPLSELYKKRNSDTSDNIGQKMIKNKNDTKCNCIIS